VELRTLFHIVTSRWWLVLPIFVLTLAAAIGLTIVQQPLYSASSTLVVAPSVTDQNTLDVISLLSRQSEISDTYAQIGSSRTVQEAAAKQLSLSAADRAELQLESVLVSGTTLLEITATSPNPEIAADYANAVSQQLASYVNAHYGVFSVSALDPAGIPSRPV
jgi:capsular polysaccharide biosynthesis protein